MDGFILTHAVEGVDLLDQATVDRLLPAYLPRQFLDVTDPVSIGAMVGPEAFEEVRYLAHLRLLDALERIPVIAEEFHEATGRDSGGLVHAYRTSDAETVVVAMGSVLGTIKDVVDQRRETGERVGVLGVTTFRPSPVAALRAALAGAQTVVILEKAFNAGGGGVLAADVTLALGDRAVEVLSVVAGLGGRPVTRLSLDELLDRVARGVNEAFSFLDLDLGVVDRERASLAGARRPAPLVTAPASDREESS
jgi:pyruvate ferredoxin oxidoreductase alpha subunit